MRTDGEDLEPELYSVADTHQRLTQDRIDLVTVLSTVDWDEECPWLAKLRVLDEFGAVVEAWYDTDDMRRVLP